MRPVDHETYTLTLDLNHINSLNHNHNHTLIIITMALSSMKTQYWPPAPKFTEKNVGTQLGKVFIVTGGNQGVGLELIKMLYPTGATIYMASRSKERAEQAMKDVTSKGSSNAATIKFLHLDLDDLSTVRVAAKAFADQESRLDILWNNAGIGAVPAGSKTKQGIEGHGCKCYRPSPLHSTPSAPAPRCRFLLYQEQRTYSLDELHVDGK
jgi:hypothetical protein